jgi:hypothetical protein
MENIARCVGAGHLNPATMTKTVGAGHRNGGELNDFTGDACPDFLCVGAQKAGTSWLYRELEPHPDFWMPPVKELHYLDLVGRAGSLLHALFGVHIAARTE